MWPSHLDQIMKCPERYAIAVRDGKDLFLAFIITRSAVGDVYLNWMHRPDAMAHNSYHVSGVHHHKGHNWTMLSDTKQPPTASFTGVEQFGNTALRHGDGRAIGIACDPADFTDVMEIPDSIITPQFGYLFDVELVEPGLQPWASTYLYSKVIQQKVFDAVAPWIAASLYEVKPTPQSP